MNIEIAQSYLGLYAELCMAKLSSRPRGRFITSEEDRRRMIGLLAHAQERKVSVKEYVHGIVDQLLFEGRPPIHCLSVCEATGVELFKRWRERTNRDRYARESTAMVTATQSVKTLILDEIQKIGNVIRHSYRGLSTKPFEQNWQRVFMDRRGDQRLRDMDAMGNIPAVFKYLAAEVWTSHGKSLPTIGDEYLKALSDPEVIQAFDGMFPGIRRATCCTA